MKRLRLLLAMIFLLAVLSSCQKATQMAAQPTINNTPNAALSTLPSITPSSVSPTPAVTAVPSRTQYRLQAKLNYSLKTLEVSEEIVYTNRSQDVLNELVLSVEANQLEEVFFLDSAQWSDGSIIEGVKLDGVKMTLPLVTPVDPKDQARLTLQYHLSLPSQPGVLSFGSRQINLSGWYPAARPYINGSVWLIHTPAKVGEYQVNEIADFDVLFLVEGAPDSF
jgi:hypothetical protein